MVRTYAKKRISVIASDSEAISNVEFSLVTACEPGGCNLRAGRLQSEWKVTSCYAILLNSHSLAAILLLRNSFSGELRGDRYLLLLLRNSFSFELRGDRSA